MNIQERIAKLKEIISVYDTESFAGFFAYFIKRRPQDIVDIELNKFDSKLKDFFYLVALNAFSDKTDTKEFDFSPALIGELADKLNNIKDEYRVQKFFDYNDDSVLHEMAFRNHFDNGVLSYVEQDLEKIRNVLSVFDDVIIEAFGLDADFLIEFYKATELISKIKFEHIFEFSHSKEFIELHKKIDAKEISFSDGFDLLPENIQDAYLTFHSKPHAYLMFSKEDLYRTLPSKKVDRFLEIFSCPVNSKSSINYYTDSNPLELAPILEISKNRYLHICQKQIPIAAYKYFYNFLINQQASKDKIRKHRDKSLERKTGEMFRSFFSSNGAFFYENYFVQRGHEQDLLVIYKGTAVIVEIKASKLREPFRNIEKAVVRLKDDFKDSIQYGYTQCRRVEERFYGNVSFDITDEKGKVLYTVNPSKIHSVFSIIVTLERFGSLQTDLSLLLQKEDAADYPWSAYIDDLEIFLLSLRQMRNRQGKFIDFLRSRKQMHGHLYAIDELDVCANFIKDSNKFVGISKMKDTLLTFSPHEQGLFDEIYHSGGLKFKEEPMPDFYRYFVNKKKDNS